MHSTDPDVSPRLLGLMSLLDLASEALWVCDLEGDLLYVNASAARFFESSPDQLRGQNVVTLGLCANGLPWGRFLDALRAAHDLARPAAMRLPSGKMVDLVIRVRLVTVDGEAP
jgi:PAS domain-containing protein